MAHTPEDERVMPIVPDYEDDDSENLDDSGIRDHYGVQPLSLRKFAIMYLSTFGFYFFYWHFRTLKCIAEHTTEPIRPLARTLLLFIPIVNIFVFERMLSQDFERMRLRVGGQRFVHNPWIAVLVWGVFFHSIVLLFVFPKSPYFVVALLALLPLKPLQLAMNIYLHRLPLHVHDETSFTTTEKFIVALGGTATAFAFGNGLVGFFEKYLSGGTPVTY